jgi:hypothetical protein
MLREILSFVPSITQIYDTIEQNSVEFIISVSMFAIFGLLEGPRLEMHNDFFGTAGFLVLVLFFIMLVKVDIHSDSDRLGQLCCAWLLGTIVGTTSLLYSYPEDHRLLFCLLLEASGIFVKLLKMNHVKELQALYKTILRDLDNWLKLIRIPTLDERDSILNILTQNPSRNAQLLEEFSAGIKQAGSDEADQEIFRNRFYLRHSKHGSEYKASHPVHEYYLRIARPFLIGS